MKPSYDELTFGLSKTRHRGFFTAASRVITTANFRTPVIIGLFEVCHLHAPVPEDGTCISRWYDFDREKSDLVVYADFPIQEFDYTADPSALAAGTSLTVGLYTP